MSNACPRRDTLVATVLQSWSCCAQMSECRTGADEETAVVQCIRERQAAGVRLADMAVLFRTVSQGKAMERALVSSRVVLHPALLRTQSDTLPGLDRTLHCCACKALNANLATQLQRSHCEQTSFLLGECITSYVPPFSA